MAQTSRTFANQKSSTHHDHKPVMAFSQWAALEALGPVVYALRLDGGVIKIGFTSNLADRRRSVRRQSGSTTTEVLAVMFGTYEDEQAIHATLVDHRHHAREYYHPTPEVLAAVNDMRSALNLPHLAA